MDSRRVIVWDQSRKWLLCGLTLGVSTAFLGPFDGRVGLDECLESSAIVFIRDVGKSVDMDLVAAAINTVTADVAVVVA